jgi:hypothetical protein
MLPFETEQNKLKIYLYISGLLDMASIILEKHGLCLCLGSVLDCCNGHPLQLV